MTSPPVRPGAEAFSLGEGPVGVLMVHGFTGSPASTRPIGAWLASQGIAVEGVRLPGHGTSIDDLRNRRWIEWVDEAGRGLDALRACCRTVVAFGQSMGGAVVLRLVASRPGDVEGIALANPYVFDARHLVIPVGRLFLREVGGVANDIAKPGQDENADERMPVPAVAEMAAMLRHVRRELGSIRIPAVIFVSGADHVLPKGSARKVYERLGSEPKELVPCPRSYHVVTLDHDAPLVGERVLALARALDAGRAGSEVSG
ncbi:MAG: alpha/beta fold hydrolase [Actinomycetota bacterium]